MIDGYMEAPYTPPRDTLIKRSHIEAAMRENVSAASVVEVR